MSERALAASSAVAAFSSALLTLYIVLAGAPWWICVGGSPHNPAVNIAISPFFFEVEVLGSPITMKMIPYLILSSQLEAAFWSFALLVGSLLPSRRWARHLLNCAILSAAAFFGAGILLVSFFGERLARVTVPVVGQAILERELTVMGRPAMLTMPLNAQFTEFFWLAIAAGLLALTARLLRRKLDKILERRRLYAGWEA